MVAESVNKALDSGELTGCVVNVDELLEVIRDRWGDLDNECGCYCNRNWMSISDFAKLVIECAYPADY